MKPLIVLVRIILIGCFWSVFFLEGIRVIMLRNWRFDIISSEHWQFAWNLWMEGWVISDAKEWAFVLIIVTFIPLWLTGWAALSLIAWEDMILNIIMKPVNLFRKIFHKQLVGIQKIKYAATPMKRKQSYKEIRPRGAHAISEEPMMISSDSSMGLPSHLTTKKPRPVITSVEPEKKSSVFEHSLLATENEDDDFVFNFDAFDVEPKKEKAPEEKTPNLERARPPRENRRDNREDAPRENNRDRRENRPDNNRNKDRNSKDIRTSNSTPTPTKEASKDKWKDKSIDRTKKEPQRVELPVDTMSKPGAANIVDIMKQKGYEVLTGTTIKNNLIDFIGIAKGKICLCILDREPGDWLADEERFNDEEPLWFSESSHRVSPVRKVDITRKHLEGIMSIDRISATIEAYVIVQLGNIINAEDMFDIWEDMNVKVTRIDRGSPKEIMLFARGLSDAGSPASEKEFEKIKKTIRK